MNKDTPQTSDVGSVTAAAASALESTGAVAHSDDVAIDQFASDLKKKMAQSRLKMRGGWDDPERCSIELLQHLLLSQLQRGDPLDIGAYSMMLHTRKGRAIGPEVDLTSGDIDNLTSALSKLGCVAPAAHERDAIHSTELVRSLISAVLSQAPDERKAGTMSCSLDELLGEYWDLAYSEGKNGTSRGSEANSVLVKLRSSLSAESKPLPVSSPAEEMPQTTSQPDCDIEGMTLGRAIEVANSETGKHRVIDGRFLLGHLIALRSVLGDDAYASSFASRKDYRDALLRIFDGSSLDLNKTKNDEAATSLEFTLFGHGSTADTGCWCRECNKDRVSECGLPWASTRMILCPDCGNKRCPKANNHTLACTRSNASGQPGSAY